MSHDEAHPQAEKPQGIDHPDHSTPSAHTPSAHTADAAPAEQPAEGRCPVIHGDNTVPPTMGHQNQRWWPERLNLQLLAWNSPERSPEDPDFDYVAAFEALDLDAVKADIAAVMHDSRPWYPADFGTYGPLWIRMAWHSAGTYRIQDGRGGASRGQQRFAPLNSWPDNVLLDRARRLLWPVKKKYGRALSWADLMILAGNVALEDMGFETFGFSGGREDVYEAEEINWGPETEWLANDKRYTNKERAESLDNPLAAVEMGLIYVNPEGPDGNPDPLASARDIRETFKRMAMNDEETVALIAGGHTFGKTHGASTPDQIGPEPEAADMAEQGLGWKGPVGNDTLGGGPEVTWTYHPTRWDNEFFHILYAYEWELMESPAGAKQWRPVNNGGSDLVPLAHGEGRQEPRMLTSDLALRFDPEYDKISRRFKDDQEAFSEAFARAWFKLTHRDLGPKTRYVGSEVPAEDLIWQDPIPAPDYILNDADIASLKDAIAASDLSVRDLVFTAWSSAANFRGSDRRGGANGARIRLEPQKDWEVHNPEQLQRVLSTLEQIQADSGIAVSLADLIVLAGSVGVEKAARAAGAEITVPFTPGRGDATDEMTDAESFEWMEPAVDGFVNYDSGSSALPAEHHLVDKAAQLNLTAPEMTVLVGGLRVLEANWDNSRDGVFTDRPGQLTNDFFVNLMDIETFWTATDERSTRFRAHSDARPEVSWTGTRADLVFGSSSELRALAEVYAADDAQEKFLADFVAAWVKVMELDRFDLHR